MKMGTMQEQPCHPCWLGFLATAHEPKRLMCAVSMSHREAACLDASLDCLEFFEVPSEWRAGSAMPMCTWQEEGAGVGLGCNC
jgi:hypothetical protein